MELSSLIFLFQEVCFQARKMKKKTFSKSFLYFGKGNFLALKNFIKLYTLNKIGCLFNLYVSGAATEYYVNLLLALNSLYY